MDVRLQSTAGLNNRVNSPVDEGALIDLRGLLAILKRRRLVILAVSVLLCALVAFTYVMMTPRYVAQATVALERGSENVVKVDQVVPTVDPDSAAVDTEVQVLQSPLLAGRVVDKLKLTQDPEFNPALKDGKAVTPEGARRRAVAILLHNLTVKRSGFSYAIDVTYQSESAQSAAKVANMLVDTYISDQVSQKTGATSRASAFLEGKLEDMRQQVESAAAAVARYRAQHGLFDASQNSSVTQEELTSLNGQLAQARAQQAEADAHLSTARAQLSRGSTGQELGEALDSPVVSQLRAQRAQISGKVASLRQQFGPKYPELAKAEKQLADIDDQIDGEVRRIVANLSIQANAARERTASIRGSLDGAEGTLAANNTASVGLAELQRKADSARTLYETFLDRYKQTEAQSGLEQSNAYIVAKARVPGLPSSPNLLIFVVIAVVAAVAGSTVAVAILHMLEAGIDTSASLEKKLGVPSLGSIPDTARLPELDKEEAALPPVEVLVVRPQSSFAEAFRRLRTSIHSAQPGRSPLVVSVTSALPGEGKTTAAIALARSAAMAGKSAVLVDCDLRRRASGMRMDPLRSIGLGALLKGKGTLDDALFVDDATGLHILPRRPDEQYLQPFADGAAFANLLAALRSKFDLIVLDTPPVLPIDDSRVISAQADCVAFIVHWRKTPAKAAELALRYLDEVGAHVVGASLSMVDVKVQARNGYGDASYYYNNYKSYYA